MGLWRGEFRSEKDKTVAANHAQILIVGVPGRIQESLRTLLKAVPDLEILGPDAGRWPVTDLKESWPDLVLLEFCQPTEELTRELTWIRAHWPSASCLVLADTARQLRFARTAGADGALLRGFGAGEFFATLRDLLKDKVCLGFESALLGGVAAGHQAESSPRFSEGQVLLASPVVF